MRPLKLMSILTITVFLCIFASSHAFAALSANAMSMINYDNFSIHYTGSGSVQNDYFEAAVEMNGQILIVDSLDAYLETHTGYAWGETNVADTGMAYQDIYSDAYTDSPLGYEYGYADAGYYGEYTANTAGTLTISIDYSILIDTQADMGQFSFAEAAVLLYIDGLESYDFEAFTAYNGMNYSNETPGWATMFLSLDLDAGQTVDFGGVAIAIVEANPVPVPGSALILGAGLMATFGIRIRRKS